MAAANLSTAGDILKAGGKVYHYPGMTHMKVLLCDGWATVGSANLDTLSLRLNRELNLAFSDPELVTRLEQEVFGADFGRSKPVKLEETQRMFARLLESIADQL